MVDGLRLYGCCTVTVSWGDTVWFTVVIVSFEEIDACDEEENVETCEQHS